MAKKKIIEEEPVNSTAAEPVEVEVAETLEPVEEVALGETLVGSIHMDKMVIAEEMVTIGDKTFTQVTLEDGSKTLIE